MTDIDEKEKQTFLEIQEKIIDAHARSKALTHQQRMKERGLQESVLIREQLNPLPENTKTFRCAGRAYFLHPREAILSQLETEAVKHKEDIEQFSNARKLIEDELKESEQQMREFLQSSPALAAKLKAV